MHLSSHLWVPRVSGEAHCVLKDAASVPAMLDDLRCRLFQALSTCVGDTSFGQFQEFLFCTPAEIPLRPQ